MTESPASHLSIELTPDQVTIVRAALRLLLSAEEDVEEIREIKALLARLEPDPG